MKIIQTKEALLEVEIKKVNDYSELTELTELRISHMTIDQEILDRLKVDIVSHCCFEDVVFDNINVDFMITCYHTIFNKVIFKHCKIEDDIRFSQCTFIDSVFDNCVFFGLGVEGCLFRDSNFKYCIYDSIDFGKQIAESHIDFDDPDRSSTSISAFLEDCEFKQPLMIFNCTLVTTASKYNNIPLVSDPNDLKLIHLRNITNLEILTIGPIGSRNDYTTYIPCIDWVQCGCWSDDKDSKYIGGSLSAFETRVAEIYGKDDPDHSDEQNRHFVEYVATITIFKVARLKYLNKIMTSAQK